MSTSNTPFTNTTNNAGVPPAPSEAHQTAVGKDPQTSSLLELFGEVIHSYSRAQAIADGVLVDVSDTAKDVGFRFPVAMTRAAWADCVEWTIDDTARQTHQDEMGRLWDVVWMASRAAKRNTEASEIQFEVFRVPRGGNGVFAKEVKLKMAIGPGDEGEPVITIMQPNED